MSQGIAHALVLGGTGHIGNAIVRELLDRGARVTVTSRRARPTPNLQRLDIDFVTVHGELPHKAGDLVPGHDLVVDAAAPYPLRIFDRNRPCGMDPVHYAACRTETLITAARRARSRLAVVGSFTTLPHPGGRAQRMEAGLLDRLHPYFEVKRTIDAAVLDAARRGLPGLVISPTAVLGPWDGKDSSLCFLPLILNGRLPFASTRVINVIDVREVATGLVRAVLNGHFSARLPLCGHNLRLCELTREACALAGVRPPPLFGSTRCAASLALWGEAGWGLLGLNSPVPSLPSLLARYSYPMTPGPAQQQLRIVPRPLGETLRDAINWYASVGYLEPARALDSPATRAPTA